MIEQGSPGHVSALRDLIDRGIGVTALAEEGQGRVQDPLPDRFALAFAPGRDDVSLAPRRSFSSHLTPSSVAATTVP